MIDDDKGCFIAIGVCLVIAGAYIGGCSVRHEATPAGAAVWVADPITGKTTLEWKGSPP